MRVFLALLLLAVTAAPAAAQDVRPDRRRVRVESYDDAARRLGVWEWGTAQQNAAVVHIMLRLEAGRVTLTVALPPRTPRAVGEKWLRDTVAALGWGNAALFSQLRPGGLFLRVVNAGGTRRAGFARAKASLAYGVLHERVSSFGLPALLAVRAPGADSLEASATPRAAGRPSGEHTLFYRLSAGGPAVLDFEYGISSRWIWAALATLGMWLVFPLPALLLSRRHVLREGREDPKERLHSFRRWQRAVLIGTLGGLFLSLWILGAGRLALLASLGGGPWIVAFYLVPMSALALAGRLVGLPIERQAWPVRAKLPWWRAAGGELSALVIALLVSLAILAVSRWLSGPAPVRVPAVPGLTPALVLALAACFAGVVAGLVVLRGHLTWRCRLRGGLPGGEVDAPEPLLEEVRLLTDRLGSPVHRVLVSRRRGLSNPVELRGGVAILAEEAAENLSETQNAALVASAAAAEPRERRDRILLASAPIAAGLAAALLVPLVWGLAVSGRPAPAVLSGFLIALPLFFLGSVLAGTTRARLLREADLRVSDALSEPRVFLDTLHALEDLQLGSQGMDPAAGESSPAAGRRTRLERALGLE